MKGEHIDMSKAKALHSWRRVMPRIIMIASALLLVAAFFLPWASADAEYREAAVKASNMWFMEEAGLTVGDAVDLSLFEYADLYAQAEQLGLSAEWTLYAPLIYATVVLSACALLLALAGKPIGAGAFAILTCALSRLLVFDFTDRGVIPSNTHDWGAAPAVYFVGAGLLIAAAIWSVVETRRANASRANA